MRHFFKYLFILLMLISFTTVSATSNRYISIIPIDNIELRSVEKKDIEEQYFNFDNPVIGGVCQSEADCEHYSVPLTNYNMLPLSGWESATTGSWCAACVYAVGSGAFLERPDFIVPSTTKDGSTEGNVIGLLASWGTSVQYKQNCTLASGNYSMRISYFNAGGTRTIKKNLIGFIANDGTEYLDSIISFPIGEWETEEINFTLSEATTGYFTMGYSSPNVGSSNVPHLFIDITLDSENSFEPPIGGGNIVFEDSVVKSICVENWDTNGDGEFSYDEAASVTDIECMFGSNNQITSFNEFQYFTGVTGIGGDFGSFGYCTGLKSLTIPSSVTSIGACPFDECWSLTSINIPASVTKIGESIAANCDSLVSLTVDENNVYYNDGNNSNCIIETASNTLITGCRTTVIPSGVTKIGDWAFGESCAPDTIIIPSTVTSIGEFAFYACDGISSLVIPSTLTHIGNSAFLFFRLNSITIDKSNPVYNDGNGCNCIIESATNTLIYGSDNTVIPYGVTTISPGAFAGAGLYSITIPSSVTSIGNSAFFDCNNLTSVISYIENPFALGTSAFESISSDCILYVPKGTRSAYIAAGWTEDVFKGGIVEMDSPSTLIAVSDKVWDFSDFKTGYITQSIVVDNLELNGNNSKTMSIDTNTKSMDGYTFTKRLNLYGALINHKSDTSTNPGNVESEPDVTYTDPTNLNGKMFALVRNGNALYGTDMQNIAFGEYDAAFSADNTGYMFKAEGISVLGKSYYLLRLITPVGGEYSCWGRPGYLNANSMCCFVLGLNNQNGQDLENGAVWDIQYVAGQGMTIKNLGTGNYLTDASQGSTSPTYWTLFNGSTDACNVHFKVKPNSHITVYGMSGSTTERTLNIDIPQFGNTVATLVNDGTALGKVEFDYIDGTRGSETPLNQLGYFNFSDNTTVTAAWNVGTSTGTYYGSGQTDASNYVDLTTYDELRIYRDDQTGFRAFFISASGENCFVISQSFSEAVSWNDTEKYWAIDLSKVERYNGKVYLNTIKSAAWSVADVVKDITVCKINNFSGETEANVYLYCANGGFNIYGVVVEPIIGEKYYSITTTGENVTITTSPAGQAFEGDKVTVTATPDTGYDLKELTVVDAENNPITLAEDNTFTMPALAVTISATVEEKEIYIETDLTSALSNLTEASNWTTITGGAAVYTGTWACPAVEVNGIGEKQVCEFYYWSCSSVGSGDYTGDVLYQTVTGLAQGTYKIELYGAAAFTFDRGFGSTAFTGDLSVDKSTEYGGENGKQGGAHIDPSDEVETGVSLTATTSEGNYSGEIPIYYVQTFPDIISVVTLDGVEVGSDGEVKLAMTKTSTSTNWHVIQLKGITSTVNAKEALAAAVARAEAVDTEKLPEAVANELAQTVADNNKLYDTAEEYVVAIKNIDDAVAKAVPSYEIITQAENGSIVLENVTLHEGETEMFTLTPDEGYELDVFSVFTFTWITDDETGEQIMDLGEEIEVTETEDAYNIIYRQDYESSATVTGWTSPGAPMSIASDSEHGNYFYVNQGSTNTRYAYTNLEDVADVSDVNNYAIEFDLAMKAGNTDAIEFCVMAKDGVMPSTNWHNYADINNGANLLFDVTAPKNSTTYTVNKGSTTTTLVSETWYHYTLNVDKTAGTVDWSISNGSSGTFTYTGSGDFAGFYLVGARYYSAIKLDNIQVYMTSKTTESFVMPAANVTVIATFKEARTKNEPGEYEDTPLTKEMFKRWDGFDDYAKVIDESPDWDGVDELPAEVGPGNTIYGTGPVSNTDYADVTGATTMRIIATPGMVFRMLLNRQADQSFTELVSRISEDGYIDIDLSEYDYVHINAIKTIWDSICGVGVVQSIIINPTDEYPLINLDADEWESLQNVCAQLNGMGWSEPWDMSVGKDRAYLLNGVNVKDGHVTSLDLSNQGLTGSFPTSVLQFPYLQKLNLADNSLNGDITQAAEGNLPSKASLQELNISNNQLTGDIGSFADGFTSLTTLDASYNALDAVSPMIPTTVTTLNLSQQTIPMVVQLHLADLDEKLISEVVPAIMRYDHQNHTFVDNLSLQLRPSDSDRTMWLSYTDGTAALTLPTSDNVYYGQSGDILTASLTDNSGSSAGSTFQISLSFDKGDSNFDGAVNVLDLQTIINYMFEEIGTNPFNYTAANLWVDEIINVQDAVCLVNLLLDDEGNGAVKRRKKRSFVEESNDNGDATLFIDNGQLRINTTVPVSAFDIMVADCQQAEMSDELKALGFTCAIRQTADGGVHIVGYSLSGEEIPAGTLSLCRLTGGEVQSAMLADRQAREIYVTLNGSATSVTTVDENRLPKEAYRIHLDSRHIIIVDENRNKILIKE